MITAAATAASTRAGEQTSGAARRSTPSVHVRQLDWLDWALQKLQDPHDVRCAVWALLTTDPAIWARICDCTTTDEKKEYGDERNAG